MIADRYRLERKVGGGRVSAMWRVLDQVTDGTCAIKLLHRSMNDHPEALARFSLEDRLSRELTGEYFPERIGSGSWHSLRYIAWRWYEGECLRSLFERNPKQDVHTVYSIVQETCQALAVVHGAGYTHGDLKPENVFFAERSESSRQLKLLGFGVASRLARPLLGAQARRTPGQIVGTPLYLSPDLILGRVPRGGQADLWALSVIVYEALTGRAPFLGSDLDEVLQKILDRQAPRPSAITNNLPGTFDLWWQQALEQQFATPAELSAGLARALAPALRSSRTQRSASLPDRTAPVMEIVVPRASGAQHGRESTPSVPAIAVRGSSLTPAGGVAAGRAPHPGVAAKAPAASAPAAATLAANSPAPSSPMATSPTGGRGANRSVGSTSAGSTNGAAAKAISSNASFGASGAASAATGGGAAAAQASAPVGSITALGVGRAQDATPLQATVVARADAKSSVAPEAPGAQAGSARSPAAALPGASPGAEAANAGTGTLVASKPAAPRGAASAPVSGKAGGAAPERSAPGPTRGDASSVDAGNAAAAGAKPAASPSATAASSAPGEPPARTPGGNVTSTTVAGIGPAALTMMRALETAASGATAKIRVAAPGADGGVQQESDKFTSVPSQLLGLGSRKTLVGIVPPPRPAASAAASAPASSLTAAVAGSRKTESLVIAGAPCKSIDVSSGEDDEELPPSIAALRRPGSPTVPFPRPRAASRTMHWELDAAAGDAPGRDTIPQSWQERTGHTLRIVLTDPDHRPHLIAGLVVCAAAALVIFAAGRSPVAGTGVLGQATRSLDPAPSPPTAAASSVPVDPLQRPASTDSVPSTPAGAGAAAPQPGALPETPQAPRLQGEELAPGLVIPPHTAPAEAEAHAHAGPKPSPGPNSSTSNSGTSNSVPPNSAPHAVLPSSAPPRPATPSSALPQPGPKGEARPAPPGHPATTGTDLHPPVAPRAAPKKPGTEIGVPARPANGDFDFGI